MDTEESLAWLQQGAERSQVLLAMTQPLTAGQLARRIDKTRDSVCEHLRQMRVYRIVHCLNPSAHQSRIYWLTVDGRIVQEELLKVSGKAPLQPHATVDWDTYGDLCFRHRRAVMLALRERMRPPMVKRRALANDARLRMSVDNCREVLYWMQDRSIVRSVRPRRERFVLYELTQEGRTCQDLLRRAEMRDEE